LVEPSGEPSGGLRDGGHVDQRLGSLRARERLLKALQRWGRGIAALHHHELALSGPLVVVLDH